MSAPHPRPWQRDYDDPSLPERVCLYKDSYGRIYTCEAVDGYPDIYVREKVRPLGIEPRT